MRNRAGSSELGMAKTREGNTQTKKTHPIDVTLMYICQLFRGGKGQLCSERAGGTLVQRGEGPPVWPPSFRAGRGHPRGHLCLETEKGHFWSERVGATLVQRGEGHPCSERGGAAFVQRGRPCSERGGATLVQRGGGTLVLREGRGHLCSERGANPVRRGDRPPLFRGEGPLLFSEGRGHPCSETGDLC